MTYTPPKILFNKHLETIYPALFRSVPLIDYTRERIPTPDQDFLDLDWLITGSSKLVVISHGLEGSSGRAYVKGMAKSAMQHDYDVLAWNYRSCSDELNKTLRFYHSGETNDLDFVIQHAIKTDRYAEINLIGFSLGGNLTLKYLGENPQRAQKINRAVTFSVPLDLHSSCIQISKPENKLYAKRFLKSLRKKVKEKAKHFQELDSTKLHLIKTLKEFDDHFTGPIHGFKNAIDYYERNSAIQFLSSIQTPTLLITAKNDPFLSPACYPESMLNDHGSIQFQFPERGGHVGFTQFNKNGVYWSEEQAMLFLTANP